MINDNQFLRNEMLLGDNITSDLSKTTVMLIGLGGVGSYTVETLARLGVGHFVLIDKDKVEISNINRQIIATFETIGEDKVEIAKKRILSINPKATVDVEKIFLTEATLNILGSYNVDYIVDAIDTITSKISLIEYCLRNNIPVISCTGMANKIDPTLVRITTLDKTSVDPICRKLRELCKKRDLDFRKINVVYSIEIPRSQNIQVKENGTMKEKFPPSSIVIPPAIAGILMTYHILKEIMKKEHKEDGSNNKE